MALGVADVRRGLNPLTSSGCDEGESLRVDYVTYQ